MARPKGASARDLFNLFVAIVPFVLLRESVSVDEVAEQFGVDRKRVIDAVKTIACDGGANEAHYNYRTELFNIDWEEFEDNEVIVLTVAEMLHVPAPFSARQRSVFLAGLELLKAHPHYRRLPEFESLIAKLRGSESSAVTDAFGVSVDASNPTAQTIADAIDRGVRVRFTYTNNSGDRASREVDPYRQDVQNGQLYFKGYCYARNEVRTFNLDSVESLEVLDIEIEPRSIDALGLTSSLFTESDDDIQVDVGIDPEALPLIAPYRRPGASVVEKNGIARITIPFSHSSTAVRMVSALPGVASIHGPSEVRAEVNRTAQAALDAYSALPR